ncbi:MAG: hypothetical protein CXZ00_12190 [Acidobacteria bacterium]|nr:MAG: hypothetical protein CXZ00_12190 [Acidobacteriota bacterium]
MKGLELCEAYFREEGLPVLERECKELLDRMAFGLVGDGSDCYGFDDEISRDHDWGPGFCIWLTGEDYASFGPRVQQIYASLPGTFKGYGRRQTSPQGGGRVGALETSTFYSQFIGQYQPPSNYNEWMALPENALAAATNGKVFQDPLGKFSQIRCDLLQFYPEDVRLKKIAARCVSLGQSGQYNLPRCVKRGELFPAQYSETRFYADAMSLVFLLNRRYAPFYKWIHRAIRDLPILGAYMYETISDLVKEHDYQVKVQRIEAMSQALISELKRQNLTDHFSDFLLDHAPVIQQRIQDRSLRERHVSIG